MTPLIQQNARDLEEELAWFARVLDTRFKLYFDHESKVNDVFAITSPDLRALDGSYARFVRRYECGFVERLALILGLIPHVRPQLLDLFFTKNQTFDRKYAEFGGVWGGPTATFGPPARRCFSSWPPRIWRSVLPCTRFSRVITTSSNTTSSASRPRAWTCLG